MKSLRNKVQLIGRLGSDPELKTTSNGKTMARINLATNESYRNSAGEKVEETQWHNLIAWNKTGEVMCQYLKKGSEVAVEGKLVSRSWNDKEGNKRYTTEVVVNDFLFLGKK